MHFQLSVIDLHLTLGNTNTCILIFQCLTQSSLDPSTARRLPFCRTYGEITVTPLAVLKVCLNQHPAVLGWQLGLQERQEKTTETPKWM